MFVGGSSDKLIELAKNEKDPELRKTADPQPRADEAQPAPATRIKADLRSRTRRPRSGRRSINALFLQNNGTVLVDARARREESGDEEGDRLEAVDHEVEGSDGLPAGAAEVTAATQVPGCSGDVQRASVLCALVLGACVLGATVLAQGRITNAQDRDALGGAGARARGARGRGARRRDLDRLPRADGRRTAADVLLRHDLRTATSAAACAASRAAAACR